jgi:glycosyltransferase involved in cell wall biosynthesis
MQKIKIAQIITRMDWGGSPDIVRLLCQGLDPEVFDITLVSGRSAHISQTNQQFLEQFKNRTRYVPQLQREINPLKDLAALFRIYTILHQGKFDLVQTHTAKAGILGRLAARLAGVKKIVHCSHGHNFYGYFGFWGSKLVITVERFFDRFSDKFIALTELEKSDLVNYRVTSPKKVAVVQSGLETEKYQCPQGVISKLKEEWHLPVTARVVGLVGRLEPVKGPLLLVEAAKIVVAACPDVQFLVIGEGSLRNKMEEQCRAANLNGNFVFAGWREHVEQLLGVLDILVLPSLNEAVGRIILEAAAYGVPVVATRVGGVPEIVKDGETGLLVPSQDAGSMARALIELLTNREKRGRLGRAAKERVTTSFTAREMVRSISNLYLELVNHESK